MKTKHFVRQSLFYLTLFLIPFQNISPSWSGELLPEIDARQFSISPVQISRTGRIYRFRSSGPLPRTGNLILVLIDNHPVMAFRVMNSDAGKSEFVGKRVRRYDSEGTLSIGKEYAAAEKIADLVSPPVSNTEAVPGPAPPPPAEVVSEAPPAEPEEKLDPNAPPLLGDDGTGGPTATPPSSQKFDEELDASTSPRGSIDEAGAEGDDAPARRSGPMIEEKEDIVKFKHMAGLTVGYFRNMSWFSIPGVNNTGFTAYYNEIIDRNLWFKDEEFKDTLSLEGGLGYYSRVNFTGNFDTYYLLPIRAELLYTLHFNSKIAVLASSGAQFNWVFSADRPTQEGLNQLSGLQANLSLGALYNIGPQWYLRGDLGLDRIAIGLAVKW